MPLQIHNSKAEDAVQPAGIKSSGLPRNRRVSLDCAGSFCSSPRYPETELWIEGKHRPGKGFPVDLPGFETEKFLKCGSF